MQIKRFTIKTKAFDFYFKNTGVSINPSKGFTLNSGWFIKNYKLADTNVSPLKGFTLRPNTFDFNYKRFGVKVNPHGFTLIELLVVLGVLMFAVGAIAIFLTSVLRGTQKANALNEVKQNSQIIVASLERQIRGSEFARNIGTDNQTIKLSRGADSIYIKCLNFVDDIANSRVGVAKLTDSSLDADEGPDDDIYISITNDDLLNGVDIENCILTVIPASNSPKGVQIPALISVKMDVVKKAQRVEFSAETSIQTTISLRRY